MQKLTFKEKIYTYQIDFVGHVNNIIYIQWLENCRMKFMEEIGYPVSSLDHNEGIVPVLVETAIKYKKPFFLHNEVIIKMWISRMNNASAIMEFNFYNENNELCATARQKGLFIDRATQRPTRTSAEQHKAFSRFLITEG